MGARPARIVSGGQTGADRGALDAALVLGIPHGGWCPAGRRAEDGVLPARYRLRETPSDRPEERTSWNVRDSEATVILSRGALAGGSRLTLEEARRLGRPHLHLDLARHPEEDAARRLGDFVRERTIGVLNLAGPRESEQPGIGAAVHRVVRLAFAPDLPPDARAIYRGERLLGWIVQAGPPAPGEGWREGCFLPAQAFADLADRFREEAILRGHADRWPDAFEQARRAAAGPGLRLDAPEGSPIVATVDGDRVAWRLEG